MTRSVFLAAALALAWAALGGVETVRAGEKKDKPAAGKKAPYVHVVIFHLKKDAPADAAEGLIADAHALLAKIPSVRGIRAGKPADRSTPDLAKKDYQVGLLVLFDDFDGLKTYLDHPLHLKYVEKHGKHIDMSKLGVYDFVDQKK